MEHSLQLEILRQPNETTCGPTCLHAVYRYYGDTVELDQLLREVTELATGGTLAVLLACHALRRGYDATIYTYNLQLFDPTWFSGGVNISERLRMQMLYKTDKRLHVASRGYLEFLARGGELKHRELKPSLIREHLKAGRPILTGLSATYLYDCAREHDNRYNDILGSPEGHFVVLSGYDPEKRLVRVADPLHDNPLFRTPYYDVNLDRLVGAIFLGIVTYDANLLIIQPGKRRA